MPEPKSELEMSVQAIGKVVEAYGPFAFSFVVFFAMWSYVVQPEMTKREVQWDNHIEVLATQRDLLAHERELATTQAVTAQSIEATATTLKETAAAMQALGQELKQNDR